MAVFFYDCMTWKIVGNTTFIDIRKAVSDFGCSQKRNFHIFHYIIHQFYDSILRVSCRIHSIKV